MSPNWVIKEPGHSFKVEPTLLAGESDVGRSKAAADDPRTLGRSSWMTMGQDGEIWEELVWDVGETRTPEI